MRERNDGGADFAMRSEREIDCVTLRFQIGRAIFDRKIDIGKRDDNRSAIGAGDSLFRQRFGGCVDEAKRTQNDERLAQPCASVVTHSGVIGLSGDVAVGNIPSSSVTVCKRRGASWVKGTKSVMMAAINMKTPPAMTA